MVVAQYYEGTKCHRNVHLKVGNFMLSGFQLNKKFYIIVFIALKHVFAKSVKSVVNVVSLHVSKGQQLLHSFSLSLW